MTVKTPLSSLSSEFAGLTPEISRPSSVAGDKRSLIVAYGSVDTRISLPALQLSLATQLWKDFTLNVLSSSPQNDLSTKEGLVAEFINFCITRSSDDTHCDDAAAILQLLEALLESYEQDFLGGNDIHSVLSQLDIQHKTPIIKAYFAAYGTLSRKSRRQPSLLLESATDGPSRIYAIFGGQGNDEKYFEDLKDTYATYTDILRRCVFSGARLLEELAGAPAFKSYFQHGFSLMDWLEKPDSEPEAAYLLSAPVSMPLIGLLQTCHFIVACQTMGLSPREMHGYLSGVSGHSQGIVVALVIAVSDTWGDFYRQSLEALRILFYISCRSHEIFPPQFIPESIIRDAEDNGEGAPSPMLRVRNLRRGQLQKIIDTVNSYLPQQSRVAISLFNGPQNLVVTGPPLSLYGLSRHLRGLKPSKTSREAQIPASKRKPKIEHRFLPITAPFHSMSLDEVVPLVMKDLADITITGNQLRIPLYATTDGHDMRIHKDRNLIGDIVSMIAREPVHWEKATSLPNATHIIDFGPGGSAGVGAVTMHNKAGQGVRLILGSSMKQNEEYGNKAELFNRDSDYPVVYADNWAEAYGPHLARDATGKVIVQTKFSELLGLPPIMIAGMTPTTVPWDFVSATMNAGYHIELAGGGYYSKGTMEEAINKIVQNGIPGRGVTCNIIYASPSSVRWQIPLLQELRAKGVPIDGMTIGAGVPSVDVANEYVETLGLKHIAFKPGSVEAIQQVIDIARENKTFPVILQWTGGRGGGHHSYEDFHAPILETYGRIRACKNIILVAGSGFGAADDTLPYLTGEWSKAFNAPSLMPFDGILLGSRVMTVKEAHTSPEAKQLIVDIPGADDAVWDQTYTRPTGGIITVRSEMGEPIHKIATRGVLFWDEMDRTVFSIADKKARVAFLQENKKRIIDGLNNNFQKVWFAQDADGKPCELNEMTLSAVVWRMVELLYIKHQARWIHHSLQQLTFDFLQWLEDIVGEMHINFGSRFWRAVEQIDEPYTAIEEFLIRHARATSELMDVPSTQMFIHLCRRRGQKPVPFIPVLDEDFEVWFKKDSLWQSEDVQAVPGQDVGRTCILHGPVAAKHTTAPNEPIKHLLDGIHSQWVKSLAALGYGNEQPQTPLTEGGMGEVPSEISLTRTYDPTVLGNELPAVETWMQQLAGTQKGWRHALFSQKSIVQGHSLCDNPVRRLFAPRNNTYIEIEECTSTEQSVVRLFERSADALQTLVVEVRAVSEDIIKATLFESRTITGAPAGLELLFSYHPEIPFAPIREVLSDKIERVKDFYHRLWFGEPLRSPGDPSHEDEFHGDVVTVTADDIRRFSHSIGSTSAPGSHSRSQQRIDAPMDYAIVVAWKSVMKPLFTNGISGNLMKLVHLSNQFRRLGSSNPIRDGDVLSSRARIRAILNEDSGKVVEVSSLITRDNVDIVEVVSRFMYRGSYTDYDIAFRQTKEPKIDLQLTSVKDVAVLHSKPWFVPGDRDLDLRGYKLTFELETHAHFQSKSLYRQQRCFGHVYGRSPAGEVLEVAYIDYTVGISTSNPIMDYLKRLGSVVDQPVLFQSPITLGGGELQFKSPSSNQEYAVVSGDYNPIHVSKAFAAYADLPDTITHGMHMSARVRSLLEQLVVPGNPGGFRRYHCNFVGMVLPHDDVDLVLQHVGMVNGRKLVHAEARRAGTGDKLIIAEAEIEQPSTAFLFTGQGSQEKGMGMELYASSPAARKVWDLADKHFVENFGFRITDIVRNDPKELKIHFGGARGRAIRENYMALRCEMIHADGRTTSEKIFHNITQETKSYTFRSSTGLLSSTQFTQPALTLMEKAIIEDMKDKGLLADHCSFAGHSLGEYSALAAIAEIMPIESLVSVVFYRGLTMQMAVERDEQGRSNFSMCAVDPSRLSKSFNEDCLRCLVSLIASETGWLLEIVNYNVANSQYVCAGDLRALDTLSSLIGEIKHHQSDFQAILQGTQPLEDIRASILDTLHQCASAAKAKPQPIQLERGVATVPLRGIDVPFHSSFLSPGITAFRACLYKYIDKDTLDADRLVGKYIPNLTARPFEVSEEYFRQVFRLTKSPIIAKVLAEWQEYIDVERGLEKVARSSVVVVA
ncbi:malonyl CoA-acyl carrier protein transacylase [Aspergillus piperis CBS 112811]|uniref:Malonyl CoA-acyl carrier protein transacylase n=1 Tax=Aspergillus piperis CBS 112811 TaxID=1448313 RepID=A0A8G1QVK0_9EURO|nr:malonyl CoA-acyl carrier protein transacylase [Aspergillus piperis CBS 112811]RAH54459.1 malonyl CoA-acyl carrier protein transacylase [Aspergillus piperis CBS 112811]